MQSYDEVTSKFNKYLSSGQKKALQKRANALSMQNSVARQNVVTDAYKGLKQQNEYLSAMGLAANLLSAPSSGADEVARRMPEMRQELRKLDAAEQGALTPVGAQMAQDTINAQLAAQRHDNGMYRISDGNGGFVKNADGTDMWVSKKDKYSIEHGGKVTDANRYSHDRVKGYQLAASSMKNQSVFEVSNKFTAAGQQPSILQDLRDKLANAPKQNMTDAVAAAANRNETNSIIKSKLGNVAGNFTNAISKVFGSVLNRAQENAVAQQAGIQNIIGSFSNNGIITQQAADALAKSVADGSVNLDDVKQQLFERLTIDFGIKTENSANAAMGNVSGGFVSTAAQQVIDGFMVAAESGKTADYDNVVNLYCDYIKEQSDANLQLFDGMLAEYYKAGMQRPELDAARAAFTSGNTELAYNYLNNFENMTQAEAILQAVNAAAGVPSGDPNFNYFPAGEAVISPEQAEDIKRLVDQGRYDEAIDVFNSDAEAYYVKRSDELWSERHEDIHQFYTLPVDEASLDEFYTKNPLVFELDKLYTLAKSAQSAEAWDMYGVAYKNLYNHKADQDRLEAQYGVNILEKVYGMSEDDSAKVMAAWDRMYNEGDLATYEQALANATFSGGIIGYEALMLRNAQLASIGVRFQDYYKYEGMTNEQIQHMIDVLEPVKTEPHPKPEMTGDPFTDAAALTQWQVEENSPERQADPLRAELEGVLRVRRIDERTEDLMRLRELDDAALAEYETGLTDRMSKTLTDLDPYATGTQYNADKMSPQRLKVIGGMLTGADKAEFDDIVDEWLLVGSIKTERGQVAKAKRHEELISGIQANEDYVQWSTYGKNRLYTKEDIVEKEFVPTGDTLIDAAAMAMNLVDFHEAQRYDTVFDVQAALQLSDEEFYEQYKMPNEIGGSGRTQFDVYRYMDDEEKGCFYYKLHESPKAAYEFLEDIKPYCTERQTRANQKVAAEAAKSHPLLSHLITYATSMPANYSSLINIATGVVEGEKDPYSEWNTLSVWNSTVRETHYADVATWLTNHNEEELVGITNFVMGGIDSWIDSVINAQFTGGIMKVSGLRMGEKAANFVGEAAGLVGFGANAYTTTLRDLDEKGINIEKSRKVATAAAFFEMFFEKIGLENILNGSKDWAKSGIWNTVKSAIIEASEEGNTTWGNITADSVFLGNQSHWADDYNAFRNTGHSVAASGALASLESVKSIGIDAAGGGFSGGLSGIVNTGRMKIQQYATGAAINAAGRATAVMDAAQSAVDNGSATPALQKLMHTVAEAYAKSNTIANTDLGKLNYLLAVSDMEQAEGAIDKLEDEGALTSKEAAAARDAFEQAYDSVSRLEDSAVYGFNQQQIDEMFQDFSEAKRKLIFKSVNENTKGRAQYHAGMNEQRIKQLAESRVGDDITGDERKKAVADEVEAIKREQEWQRVERAKKAVGYQSVEVDDNIVNSMPTIATENYDGVEVRLHKYQNTEQMGYMNKLRLDFVRAMSKASGVSVVVHDTLPVNGALESNGVMHISLDAQGVGSAIGHELTHFIRQHVTGDEWQNFVKFIKETATKRDKHGFERLVERNMQKYAKVMENLTEAQKVALAEEETICGLCEDVLKDDVRMQEFFEESPTLFGKVCAWLDRVVKHFKEIVGEKSYNARLMQHDIEELRDKWFAAFKVATKNAADKKVQKAAETGYAEELGGVWMYSMKDDEYMQMAETYVRAKEEANHYRNLAWEMQQNNQDGEYATAAETIEQNAKNIKDVLEAAEKEAVEERTHKWDISHGTRAFFNESTTNMNFSLKNDIGDSEQYKLDVEHYNSALKTWTLLQDTLKEAEANGDAGEMVRVEAAITKQLDELSKYVIDAGEQRGYTQLVFHGTSAAFDTFSPDYEKFGLFGKGVYTTESEDVANSYQTKEKGNNNRTLKMLARIGNEIDMDAVASVSIRETMQAIVDNVNETIENTLTFDADKENYRKDSIAADAERLVEPIGEFEDALITEMPITYDGEVFSRATHEKVCGLFKHMNKAVNGVNEVPEGINSYRLYLQAARGLLKPRGGATTQFLRELGWMVELRKLAALGDEQSAIEYEQRKQKYTTEYRSRFSNIAPRVWQLSDADIDFWEHILDTGKTFNTISKKAREAAYAKYKELYGFKEYGYDPQLKLLEDMMDRAAENGGINTNEDVYDIVIQLLMRSDSTGLTKGKYKTYGANKNLNNLSHDAGTILKAAWSRMGYTGITHTGGLRMGNGNEHRVHIFFNAQQDLKYADPITYYKNGKPIKLGKRFDDTKTGSETLKFSLKDSDFERRDNDFLEAFRAGNKVLLHKINTEAEMAAGVWSRDGHTYEDDVAFYDNGDPIPPSKRYNLKEKAWMYSLKEDRETKKDAPKLFSKTWFAKVKKFQTVLKGDNMQYFSVKGTDFEGDDCTYVGNQYMIAKVKGDYDIEGEFNGTSTSKNTRAFDDLFKNASGAENSGRNMRAEDIPSVKELDAFIKRAKELGVDDAAFRLDTLNYYGDIGNQTAWIDAKALKAALEVVGDKECSLFVQDAVHPVYFVSADGDVEAIVCPVRIYGTDLRAQVFSRIYDGLVIEEEDIPKAEYAPEEDENARIMNEFEEQQKREAEKDAARKAIRERAEAEVDGKYKYYFTGDLESDIDNVMLITGKDRELLWKEAENTAESVYGKEIPEGKVENIFSNNLRHANERNVESLEEEATTFNPEDEEDANSLYYVYKELAEVNAKKALLSKLADAIEKVVPVSGEVPTTETAPVETKTEPVAIPETETNEQVPVTESTEPSKESQKEENAKEAEAEAVPETAPVETTEPSKEDQKKANAKWRKEAMQDFLNERKKEAEAIAAEYAEERAAIQEAEGVTPDYEALKQAQAEAAQAQAEDDAWEEAWQEYMSATYGGLYKTKEEAYEAMTADLKKQQEEEDKYAAEVRAARFHVHDGTRTAPHITEQIQGMDDTPVLYEAQRITEKTPDENGEVKLIPKVIRDIVKAAKASNFLGLKDYSRVMDKVSGKNREIREALSTILEKPFLEAGYRYTHNLPAVRANYMDSMKELGITGENYEKYSAAMQHYGEGYIVVNGEKVDYTLNDLKKDCPENWQQVKKAAEITRDLYDDYVDRINTMLEGIYPDVIEHAYTDKRRLDALVEEEENKSKAYRERAGVVYQQLEKAKARAAKAKHGTDKWAKANASVAMYERRLENVKLIAAKHEGRAAVRRAQAQQITQALATGDEIRNKRLIRRADYMHHTMKEESQNFVERVKNAWTGTAGEIPPELVGKTDITKPKTGHAKFMDKRRGIDSKADAVGSMLSYIEQAERKLAYDPFIAHLSYIERLVEEAAQDEYEATGAVNANDFKRFIHEWRNDIAGKSNPIDRAFSDSNILPRNLYETLQTLGGRANANAVLFNFGSAAVQASNIVNAATYVTNVKDWLTGAYMFARMEYSDAADAQQLREIYQQSTFMTQRYGMELANDPRNNDSKLKKFATAMMGALDELAGKWMWFSAYNQYNEKRAADVGHTYSNAIEYADDITRRSVAGRGIGERPFTLTSKFVNTAAPFQLEIANTMQNIGEQFGKKNLKGLTLFALTTYAMNLGFKALFGTKKLPWDVIDMLVSAVTDGFDDDDDEEEVGVGTKALRTGRNILQGTGGMFLESIPFNSVVLGQLSKNATGILGDYAPETFGSSSLGYGTLLDTSVSAGKLAAHGLNGNWSNFDVFWTDFLENSDWLKMVLPYGGTQAQRSLKGIDAAVRGYSQKINSEGELEAQFAVSGFFDALRSATLGKWATAGGRAYLAGETKKLTAEETAELKASDLPAKDFFAALQALKDAKKTTKNAYGETVVTSSANQYAAIRDAKPELQMTMLNRMGEKAAGAALKAVDNGVDLNTWLDYMVDYGTHDPESDEGRNAEIRNRLVADVASGKLTNEQAAYMDAAITGAKTVHDYTSPEWYELSGNESHYNMAKWANSQGIDPTLALTWYNNKSVKTLDEYGNEKSIPQEEVLKDLQRNVAQGTLTEEQAAILETMLYPDKKNKRDFSSSAAFEISASDSNYAYYKASGLDADMALRWYNFKAEKSPDAAGVMHSRKKEEVEDALAQATDMTTAQKEAAHRMIYPDGSKVPDYRSYTWYKIYKSGDSNYKKALFAVRDGAPVEAALKEIEAYNAAKAAGKTWKAKDTKAFCYSLGLPKGQADALYYAMSGKTKK